MKDYFETEGVERVKYKIPWTIKNRSHSSGLKIAKSIRPQIRIPCSEVTTPNQKLIWRCSFSCILILLPLVNGFTAFEVLYDESVCWWLVILKIFLKANLPIIWFSCIQIKYFEVISRQTQEWVTEDQLHIKSCKAIWQCRLPETVQCYPDLSKTTFTISAYSIRRAVVNRQ